MSDEVGSYFSDDELRCKHSGELKFDTRTLAKLNKLRHKLGQPVFLSSAYRSEEHNNLIGATQTHATGQAVDIRCSHEKAYRILELAFECGFTGIGISQKGDVASRFIHLDDLTAAEGRPRPHIWSYK